MGILLLLGLVLIGVATVFGVRTVAFGRLRRSETLAQIGAYGFDATAAVQSKRIGLREVANRLAARLGTVALRRLNEEREQKLLALLRGAGHYRTEPATFLGYRIGVTAILPGLWLWLAVSADAFDTRAILALCLMAGFGWTMPGFILQRRATTRRQQIDREMPELVDLLVTTVEAGVGFASALQLVARRVQGPLGQELRLALQEQNMGLTIEEALDHMLTRVDSPAIRAFVQAILQGQLLGVSIGKILRDLAVDMRKRRRQMAEERAQKAPTKILFPLVFFILPALMIVAIGGPMIGLIRNLGSM